MIDKMIEDLKNNNAEISKAIGFMEESNNKVSTLLKENEEMRDLLSTFKSMFKDRGNDLYLSMIKNLKTKL